MDILSMLLTINGVVQNFNSEATEIVALDTTILVPNPENATNGIVFAFILIKLKNNIFKGND